jgi:hypothetical protein
MEEISPSMVLGLDLLYMELVSWKSSAQFKSRVVT